MNNNVIKYLQENRNKYSKDVLIISLKNARYKENDIIEGINSVYEDSATTIPTQSQQTSFWNFKDKRNYNNKSEKIKDFIFGFIVLWIIHFLIGIIFQILLPYRFMGFRRGEITKITAGIILFVPLFHLFNKRRFMFYGAIASLILLIINLLGVIRNSVGLN